MAITETETRAETVERERDAFRTIVAKYPGKCQRCKGDISEGETVRWLKPKRDPATGRKRSRGRTYHLAARCPGPLEDTTQDWVDDGEE